jgi:hypothetical protein
VLLVCLLVLVGVVGGCGSSAAPTPKSSAPRTTATVTVPLAVKLRESVVACRKAVKTLTDIPASEQLAAQADCNGIRPGHIGALKSIFLQACQGLVAKLPLVDRGPAAQACEKTY